MVASSRMPHMIGAAAHGPAGPGVEKVDGQGTVHADGGVQAGGRLPGPITNAGHEHPFHEGRLQGDAPPVADHARGVSRSCRKPLPEAAPPTSPRSGRCLRRRVLRPAHARAPGPGAARFPCPGSPLCRGSGSETRNGGGKNPWKRETGPVQCLQHVREIIVHRLGQHETVVEPRAPAHQLPAIGGLPEPGHKDPQEQLLGQAHAGVGRHLKGAKLQQPQPAGGAVRGDRACRCRIPPGGCCR